MEKTLHQNKQGLLFFLAMIYAVLTFCTPLLNGQVVSLFGIFTVTMGFFPSTLAFVLINILSEFYPKTQIKTVLNVNMLIRPIMVGFLLLLLQIPFTGNVANHLALEKLLSSSLWFIFIGVFTHWGGQRVNLFTNTKIAQLTKGKLFFIRSFTAMFLGTFTNTVLHQVVGYGLGGLLGFADPSYPIIATIIGGTAVRLTFDLLCETPITTFVTTILRKFGYVSLKETKGENNGE